MPMAVSIIYVGQFTPEGQHITMDSTLIGAILGAIATIVAALMSKSYADHKIKFLKSSDEIQPLTRIIIRLLGFFRINGAALFLVKEKRTFIDDETGITITAHNFHSNGLDFEYQLPGQTNSKRVKVSIGWKSLFNYMGNIYALTLVQYSYGNPSNHARFDFRKINEVIIEVEDKDVEAPKKIESAS
jgi:hypothetical protein